MVGIENRTRAMCIKETVSTRLIIVSAEVLFWVEKNFWGGRGNFYVTPVKYCVVDDAV